MSEQKVSNTITILYFAFLSSTILYLILGFILHKTGWAPVITHAALSRVITLVFVLIAAALLFLILRLKQRAFSEEVNSSKNVISKTLPLFALSEIPAILGLVNFFLTGNLLTLIALCVLSLIAFTLAKPSTAILDQIDKSSFHPTK